MEGVLELLVTCLACGEQWHYAIPSTLAGCLSLLAKRQASIDECPACGAHQASFTRCESPRAEHLVNARTGISKDPPK